MCHAAIHDTQSLLLAVTLLAMSDFKAQFKAAKASRAGPAKLVRAHGRCQQLMGGLANVVGL